jgi:hypothetical protein
MGKTRFDRELIEMLSRPAERLAQVTWTDRASPGLRDSGLALLERGRARLVPAVDLAVAEDSDAYAAAEGRRVAEAAVEGAYEALHSRLRAAYYDLAARDAKAASAFEGRMTAATGDNWPAAFRALSLAKTEDVMGSTLGFAAEVLPADDAPVVRARGAFTAFADSRRAADREQGQAIQAMKNLEAARDEARRLYVAARKVVDAALTLEGIDTIARYMPPLSSIYGSAPRPAAPDPDPAPTA